MGLQGILLKVRATRSNQTLEFPIMLSHHYEDWKLLAAAYVVPPVAFYALTRFFVRPIITWQKKRTEIKAREEHAEEVNEGLRVAAKERALLAPVAKRKARTELTKVRCHFPIVPQP